MTLEQLLQQKKQLFPKNSPVHILLSLAKELQDVGKLNNLNPLEYFIVYNCLPDGVTAEYLLENYKQYIKEKTLVVNSYVLAIWLNREGLVDFFSNQSDLDCADEHGYFPIEYVSVVEDKKMFSMLKPKTQAHVPVFGRNYSGEDKLMKNFAFDKCTVIGSESFLLHSPYNFLESKNVNEAIKKVYPSAGKKTSKLILDLGLKDGFFNFKVVHLAHFCRQYLEDVNQFNEVLESIFSIDFYEQLIPLHFITQRMSHKRVKEFIINASKYQVGELSTMVNDTMNQYRQILRICQNEYEIDFKAIDNVKKLHDLISADYLRMSRHGQNIMLFLERKFPFLEELKKEKFRNLDIIIPQDKATLIEWGEKMGNCIGGYGERARDGDTIVLALYENGDVKFNIEVCTKDLRIVQFVSHSNAVVDEQTRQEFQRLVDTFKEGQIQQEDGTLIRLPIDHRFLVRILKTDTPVDEEQSELNKLFQLNLSPLKTNGNFLNTSVINGFEEDIPRSCLSLIVEDQVSKGELISRLASVDKVAYTGLLKQFKGVDSAFNFKEQDYSKVGEKILQLSEQGYKSFYIGLKTLMKFKNKKFPTAMGSEDYRIFLESLEGLLDLDINIFLVVSDVVKSKELKFDHKSQLLSSTHQVFYTHKAKAIDEKIKIDVIKNLYGSSDCAWVVG